MVQVDFLMLSWRHRRHQCCARGLQSAISHQRPPEQGEVKPTVTLSLLLVNEVKALGLDYVVHEGTGEASTVKQLDKFLTMIRV